jgi:hypothetical protein
MKLIENPAEFVGSVAVPNKPDRAGAAELYARIARRDRRQYAVTGRSTPLSPNLPDPRVKGIACPDDE